MASAAGGHHIIVLFENDVFVVVVVQQTDRVQLVGNAAWLADAGCKTQLVDDALHRRMIRRPLVLAQRKRAGAFAVIRLIPLGRYDPGRPADFLKVYIQIVAGARCRLVVGMVRVEYFVLRARSARGQGSLRPLARGHGRGVTWRRIKK